MIPKLVSARNAPEYDSTSPEDTKDMGSVAPSKGASQDKLGSNAPSNDERLVNGERSGPTHQVPSGSLSVSVRSADSGHLRVGMDGIVQTDEEPDSSSSDDEDWGGPRFAPSSGTFAPSSVTLRTGSTHSTAMHSIEEALDESTTSM